MNKMVPIARTGALLAGCLLFSSVDARELDIVRWGIGARGGAAFPVGEKRVRSEGSVGLLLGAELYYGISPKWRLAFQYDNLDVGVVRVQPFVLSGIYLPRPDRRWRPSYEFGLGAASGSNNRRLNNLTLHLAAQQEYQWNRWIGTGPFVAYDWIIGNNVADVHAVSLGVAVKWTFRRKMREGSIPTLPPGLAF
jgi:hypothetical protein